MKPETCVAAPPDDGELVQRVLRVAALLAKALEAPENERADDENAAKNTDAET